MDDALRTQLESQWNTSAGVSYSYEEWETKRKGDWQRLVSQHLPELGKAIAVDSGLFTYMQSNAVFDRRTIESFKQKAGNYAQVSSILHALDKQSFGAFIRFCQCLIETGQTGVIVSVLTPELQQQQQHPEPHHQQPLSNVDVRYVAGDAAAASQVLSAVELRHPEEEEAGSLAAPGAGAAPTVVDYDWKAVIRENFMELTQHVDPDSGFLTQLQSRGVISSVPADVIKSKKGRANRVGAILDHVTQFRPDSDFVQLLEALVATNQGYVVRDYLTKDARRVSTDAASATVSATVYQDDVVDVWRTVLIQRRSDIIDLLDCSDEFVNRLVAYGVMNFATGETCREEPDEMKRSEFVLDHMQRRASLDMAYFCQALDDTTQQHIVRDFFQKSTDTDCSAVANQ